MNKISIIICSRTKTITPVFLKNIENTVGVNYELIVIDNSENNYSIFEAYNLGIKKSEGELLCFMHDDVLLHTNNWGTILIDIFNNNKNVGLLGVAGAKVKTKMPSPWWNCHYNQQVINIIQHNGSGVPKNTEDGFGENSESEVVVIDGVFMVLKKSIDIMFNENMKGYHNYDLNISFECKKKGYQVLVTNQILIEHFSSGSLNKDWVESSHKLHNIYKSVLPLQVELNSLKKGDEIRNAVSYMEQCLTFNKHKICNAVWKNLFLLHPILSYHFKLWKRLKEMRS
ncbi:glycosyltransferase family protein [Flavobacteriaceae bacterium S0825]|uniref:glycosyltransferase n=1 Tax=Gaetbulibacter sp. S0825 TaxID=2720084 RepID=UPI001430E163|nr:glycosyltransferase family protein [Flavobacteriaceae bacterium S0825]NIX64658.1 hypothetical protein [Gaetbulibacter sp. S0825]